MYGQVNEVSRPVNTVVGTILKKMTEEERVHRHFYVVDTYFHFREAGTCDND